MIKFSAPGKIHLLGEHAVVYGKPAILATLNLRIFVTVENIVIISEFLIKFSSHSHSNDGKILLFFHKHNGFLFRLNP